MKTPSISGTLGAILLALAVAPATPAQPPTWARLGARPSR